MADAVQKLLDASAEISAIEDAIDAVSEQVEASTVLSDEQQQQMADAIASMRDVARSLNDKWHKDDDDLCFDEDDE